MKNRDYREIQLSSSQLAIIFLFILILGVVIFLLGVSVGKKHAQITKNAEITTPAEVKQVKKEIPLPVKKQKDTIREELASYQKIKEETQKKPPVAVKKNLYYVQVGAFNKKDAALIFAEGFKKRGYPAFVLDPLPPDKPKQVFRVRIGGFETREKAQEVLSRLNSESKKKTDYYITL